MFFFSIFDPSYSRPESVQKADSVNGKVSDAGTSPSVSVPNESNSNRSSPILIHSGIPDNSATATATAIHNILLQKNLLQNTRKDEPLAKVQKLDSSGKLN